MGGKKNPERLAKTGMFWNVEECDKKKKKKKRLRARRKCCLQHPAMWLEMNEKYLGTYIT